MAKAHPDGGANHCIIRIDRTAVPGVQPGIALYDAKGKRLKTIHINKKGKAAAIINVGVTEGTYFIQTNSFWANKTDKYTLTDQMVGPWEEGQEFEPNDRREDANALRLGEPIEGLIQSHSESDW